MWADMWADMWALACIMAGIMACIMVCIRACIMVMHPHGLPHDPAGGQEHDADHTGRAGAAGHRASEVQG